MRILHIAQTLPGGLATYLEGIASFQISRYGEKSVRFFIPASQRFSIPGVPEQCIIPCQYDRRNIIQLYGFMREGKRAIDCFKPDIIHLHSTFAGALFRISYFFRRRRRPTIVYCAHGWAFLRDDPPWKKRIYVAIERELARITDAVVNVSRHEFEAAINCGIPRHISHLVLNGSPGYSVPVNGIKLFDQASINLLFVGRFDRQKGFDILLGAMRELMGRPVHLYVIGGPVLDSDTMVSCAFNPPPNVTFLGWLPRAEVGDYYSAADAVVMPSRWEAFGLTAVEALSHATPVIASDRGALPEIIVSGECGLIVPEMTSKVLANAIVSLDKSTLKSWGKKGRQRQRKIFSVERQNRELVLLYEKLCNTTENDAN